MKIMIEFSVSGVAVRERRRDASMYFVGAQSIFRRFDDTDTATFGG